MARIINTLLLLVACVLAIGFYRGWFTITSQQDVDTRKVNINVTVDTEKVKEDTEKVKSKTAALTHQVTGETSPSAENPTPPVTTPATP